MTFAVLCSVNQLFFLFTRVYEEYFKKSSAVRPLYGKFLEVIGLHDFHCYLLACRFVEFNTSVICYLLMHSFDSFLLRDMFLRL